MNGAPYIDHIKQSMKDLEARIADTRRAFEEAAGEAKAERLDALERLETRHRDLQKRLEDAYARHAEDWSALRAGFQEDIDALTDAFERLILHYT